MASVPWYSNKQNFGTGHPTTQGPRPLPWKSIVVVFGDDDKAIAEVYPSGDPRDFDFPERALLK